jgi:hypothetical protein
VCGRSERSLRSLYAAARVALQTCRPQCQGAVGVQAGALASALAELGRVGSQSSSGARIWRRRGGARRRARARVPRAACQRCSSPGRGVSEGDAWCAGAALAAGPADADAAGAAHGGLQHAAGACTLLRTSVQLISLRGSAADAGLHGTLSVRAAYV